MLCGPRQCSHFCGYGGSCAPVLGLLLPTLWEEQQLLVLDPEQLQLWVTSSLAFCLLFGSSSTVFSKERWCVGRIPYGGCTCSIAPSLPRLAQLFVTSVLCFYHSSPWYARKNPNETFCPFLTSSKLMNCSFASSNKYKFETLALYCILVFIFLPQCFN